MPLPVDRAATRVGPGDPLGPGRTGRDPGAVLRDPFDMAFPPGVAAKLGWYVYLLTDPGSGQPFYVGRGRGDQCFRHLEAGRRNAATANHQPSDASDAADATNAADGFPELERIREVEGSGSAVQLEILRYRMSSDESRLVQAATADVLGLQPDLKLGGQRQPAAALGTRLAKRAKFKRDHLVVLLRIGDRGADMGYETVRHDWRIGRRWIDPSSSRSPRWAVIVAGELIVAVYGIERWEPTPLPGPAGPVGPSGAPGPATFTARSTYRHSFIGERDDELEGRYVGKSVRTYLSAGPGRGAAMARAGGVGAQNQVTYVWCGPHWVNPTG
jgi:hypothetical protein